MRFIFKVLLGMIIFNVMLVVFSGFFDESTAIEEKEIIGDTNYTSYKDPFGSNLITDLIKNNAFMFAGILITAGIAGFFISNFPTGMFIGAGFIISLIVSLWFGLTKPLITIGNTSNELSIFLDLFMICIGLIATFSIIEIFTGRGDTD